MIFRERVKVKPPEHKSKIKTCFKDNRSNMFRDYDPEECLEIFTGIFSDLVIKLVNDNKLEVRNLRSKI